jgi:hypothetical protein
MVPLGSDMHRSAGFALLVWSFAIGFVAGFATCAIFVWAL